MSQYFESDSLDKINLENKEMSAIENEGNFTILTHLHDVNYSSLVYQIK